MQNEINPNKTLGQNFLHDKNQIRKIIESSQPEKDETILEIGPGLGAITLELAQKAKKIICVEKDRGVIPLLEEKLKETKIANVKIINEDILKLFQNNKLVIDELKDYKVIANIPYYLTSILIRNLLEIENQPKDIFLMIQKEVGQRICAKPGNMSILALSVQYYATPKILFTVPKGCFFPPPKIDSVFIQIIPRGIERNNKFFELIKVGFSHPRKQLINNLSHHFNREIIKKWLEENNLKPGERAEVLSLEQWKSLFTLLEGKA